MEKLQTKAAPPSVTTSDMKLYNAIKGKYSRMRSAGSFVWSELLPGIALEAAKSPSICL